MAKVMSCFVRSNLSLVTPNDLKDFEISNRCTYGTKQKNEEKGDITGESISITNDAQKVKDCTRNQKKRYYCQDKINTSYTEESSASHMQPSFNSHQCKKR